MNQIHNKIRVAIIGGGVAGLSAAFRLREELRTAGREYELVLFEQENKCGGATQTITEKGYALEHGPNGWLSSKALTGRLIEEVGRTGELISAT